MRYKEEKEKGHILGDRKVQAERKCGVVELNTTGGEGYSREGSGRI